MLEEQEQNTVPTELMSEPMDFREVPSTKYSLKDYELNIRFLSSGVLVSIGCKQIAFETIDRAMEEINAYVKNPKASYEKWNKIFIN